jgi:hypothetical protein
MSKKKNDNHKPLTKSMAAVLSATIAATSVISVLPANIASADEVSAIAAVNAAATAAEMQSALVRVDLALNLTGYDSLSSPGKVIVAQNMLDFRIANGSYSTQPSIQEQLNAVVAQQQNVEILQFAINAVNVAATASAMRTALEDPALGLILTTYNNLSTPNGKLEAAQLLLDYRVSQGSFANQAAIQNQFNIAVQTTVDNEALAFAVNSVNDATDAATMTTALEDAYLGLVLTSFHNLAPVDKDWVAQEMYTYKQANGAFANKAAIQTKLNALVTQRAQDVAYAAAVQIVNDASTNTEMKSALEASNLGLTLTEYYKLNTDHRLAAAQAVLDYKTANGNFANQSSVQATLSAAVAIEQVAQAVDVVNAAADASSMKSALTSTVLGLSLTVYDGLLTADKNAVAAFVLANRGAGFTDQAAVQAGLDAAVLTNAPMAAVNLAADAAAAQTALEAAALGLDQGADYPTWLSADQAAVAAAVVAARSAQGYVNFAAVQAAFDTAVTARTPVAAVNLAADEAAIQSALEAGLLDLTLGADYTTEWLSADKTAVAADVLLNRPTAGFVDKQAVQTAFNAALAARAAVAAVNTAADDAAAQAALESGTLALDPGAYASWTAADKKAVAVAVRAARPGAGYTNTAAVQAAFDLAVASRTDVAAVNIATDAAAMQAALEESTLLLNLGASYAGWQTADKTAVATAVLAARPGTGFEGLAAIQAAFDTAVAEVAPLADINGAGNAAAMQAALEDGDLGLTLGTAYSSLSPASQEAVAAWVLSQRPAGGYADKPAVQTALDLAVAIEYVNIAADAEEMQEALEDATLNLTFGAYTGWKPADKAAVADDVLAARTAAYVDKAAIQAEVDAAILARTAVAAVNGAADAAAIQTALESGSLSLTFGAYTGWKPADKAAVAAAVLGARPTDGYAAKVDVQTAFTNAVTARTAVAAVNGAADAAAIQTALESVSLGLTLGAYTGWSTEDKATVAAAVLSARPTDGFVDAAAIQTAFDTAVSTRSYVAAVNIATDAAAMQAALENSALGLTFGAYDSWTAADKAAVAVSVLTDRPGAGAGYADQTAIQTAFDTALATRLPVASVNIAVGAVALQAALEAATLDLELDEYATWKAADKEATVAAILLVRPVGGFVDDTAIQTAVDTAVENRRPIAAVNIAANVAAMLAAVEDPLLNLDLTEYDALLLADQWLVADHLHTNRPADGFTTKDAVQLALDSAIDAEETMAAVNRANDVAEMETALENVDLGIDFGEYANWKAADQTAVAQYVLDERDPDGYVNVAAVQAAFDAGVEAREPVAAVNSADTAAEVETALENGLLGLTLGAYTTWTVEDQKAVAAYVLGERDPDGYVDVAAIQAAFDDGLAERAAVAAVNIAATDAAMQAALADGDLLLTLGAFTGWADADQLAVAASVRSDRPAGGYTDQPAIQTAFDDALAARTAVAAVNLADEAEIQAALEDASLGLTLGVYQTWSDADKEAVAAAVFGDRPTDGYADLDAIQDAFDTAVSERAAVAAVNTALDATTMQAALEDAELGLTLGAYADWTDADHIAVAEAVLAVVPETGFVNAAAVQAVFNTAVTNRTAVANVNIATTAAAIQTALQDNGLGLDLTIYNTLGNADRLDIADKVLAARPSAGYTNQPAIQTALDNALSAGALNRDLNALQIQFADGDAASHVTGDLELPTAGAEGSIITWTADLSDIVAIAGTTGAVTRPAYLSGDATVTLTAELTYDGESKAKEFVIKVIKEAITDSESVVADKAALDLGYALPDSVVSVTQNLTLYAAGANGTTITWDSSDTDVIGTDGTVTRPLKTSSDAIVTLTATIEKNGAQSTKVFQVNVLKQSSFNDAEAVTVDKAALDLTYAAGDKAAGVTQNLTLQTAGLNGTAIAWSSSDPSVVAADGTVTRPVKTSSDANVTLTATISRNGVEQTKEFNVYVLKSTSFSDAESVSEDKAALEIYYAGGDSQVSVTQSLNLALAGANGTTVTWESSDITIVAENGTVNRPAKTASDALVTLTATITKNGVQQTKVFHVNVLKLTSFNDTEAVAADKAALDIAYAGGDTVISVTQNLTLPTAGTNGTTIAWSSNNTDVVAANGTVNRPANTASDALVTLTATITKNGQQLTKVFYVNVLKLTSFNDTEAVAADKAALDITYAGGDSVIGVTQNVTLPATGANGTIISWTSSNTDVVTANGAVTRPLNTESDALVILTATIAKNGQQQTKVFYVNVLKSTSFNDEESVSADTAALEVYYAGSDTQTGVTQNLTLPAAGSNGTTIAWSSNNADVVTANGTVNRPANTASDALVTLTATITKNGVQQTKIFHVNVLKLTSFNDTEAVAADKAALDILYGGSDSIIGVTQNVTLPTTGANGTIIAWSSNNNGVLAASGTVNRPAKTASDALVTLTATITKNGQQQTKVFYVNVLKSDSYTNAEAVAADKAALDLAYAGSDTMVSVTQNLTLPTTGANGTAIAWTSSNTDVVAIDGAVTRPLNTSTDALVTLTATISLNGTQATKVFYVNVLKQTSFNDAEAVAADKAALELGYSNGDTAAGVTKNLTLPQTGLNNTNITWSSNNAAIVINEASGVVTRPANLAGDVTVTLTATITRENVSEQKSFQVTVLKNGKTATPSDILVTNNVNQADTIQVSGLLAGDIVKVYDSANLLLGTATVLVDATSASVVVAQLGAEAGSVAVTVTRPGLEESNKVNVVYAAEGAKPFAIAGNPLVKTNGILAKVTIAPTQGMIHSGKEVVVFQLMKGTEPVSIVVLEKDIVAAEELTAHFNVAGSGYTVKVFVVDSYSGSFTEVGNSLASAIVLQ